MSRLLVVLADGTQLAGALADAQRVVDGVRVFYRDGTEVVRVQPGQRVVVRDTAALDAARRPFPPFRSTPTLTNRVGSTCAS